MNLSPTGGANAVEQDGQQQVDHFISDQDATQNGCGHRLHDLGTGAGGPEHRRESDHGRQLGHQLGAQSMDGSFHHGFANLRQRQVFQAASLLDRFTQVDQDDESAFGREAETGDEADPDRDAEVVAKQILKQDAAEDCTRNGQAHHDQRIGQVVIDDEQQNKDRQHDGGNDDRQRSSGAEFMFKLASPFDIHPSGHGNGGVDGRLRFFDKADDVAVANIQSNVGTQQSVLAANHRRALDDANVGDL